MNREFRAVLEKLASTRPRLVEVLRKYGDLALADYAPKLWEHTCKPESLFIEVLRKELLRRYSQEYVSGFIEYFGRRPVLQTTHHLTPSVGPTFNSVDVISMNGLKSDAYYPVGFCSGVAFSNPARSGALCFGTTDWEWVFPGGGKKLNEALKSQKEREAHGDSEKRFSLIPASSRDAMVYGYRINDRILEKWDDVRTVFGEYPAPEDGQEYSDWCLAFCEETQRKVFGFDRTVFFDLNRVVAEYLILAEERGTEWPVDLEKDTTGLFLENVARSKSDKIRPVTAKVTSKQAAEKLKSKEWCPAVKTLFSVLIARNGIKCLGSFSQGDYLTEILPDSDTAGFDPALTTGRLQYEKNWMYSLDYLLRGESIPVNFFSEITVAEAAQPILTRLADEPR